MESADTCFKYLLLVCFRFWFFWSLNVLFYFIHCKALSHIQFQLVNWYKADTGLQRRCTQSLRVKMLQGNPCAPLLFRWVRLSGRKKKKVLSSASPFACGPWMWGMRRLHSRTCWAGCFCGDFMTGILFGTGSRAAPTMPFQAFGTGLCLPCLKRTAAPLVCFFSEQQPPPDSLTKPTP